MNTIDPRALLRLKDVLQLIRISRTSWWSGVKTGKFPKPIKLGPKTTVWRAADIFAVIERVTTTGSEQ